ncbi:MAG: sugar ABC transporter ATP-binding protein [Rhizobiaceae bacterium]|nr:sugar ABC transporter ATP-binding protein [Rhizobiaceae bacterium]
MISFDKVTKRFGSNLALCEISFDCAAGSVHAVTGENGAGKSTLMNLLAGIFPADGGEIRLRGEPIAPERPSEARRLGISTIFQELTLLPNLTIAENLFLGREPMRGAMVNRRLMQERAREIMARLGSSLDVDTYCGDISLADQHLVEIAKGVSVDADVYIFDEPTAALNAPEVEKLGALLESLKAAGKLVFYVSHRLDEIFRFCDRVSVLKDGRHVETRATLSLTRDELVSLMVGRVLSQFFPARPTPAESAPVELGVRDLQVVEAGPKVSLALRAGEIVGLAGLEGQGQRSIIRALAGLHPSMAGEVTKNVAGEMKLLKLSVVETVMAGIGFVPEDRKTEGLYLPLSINQNIALGMLPRLSIWKIAPTGRNLIADLMLRMNVRSTSAGQEVGQLSGGNQQKVMIGRWLAAGINVLLLEEPTRGVDVGAKTEIYGLLRDFAHRGGAVLVVSSELLELLGLCDRILVVRQNEIVAELEGAGTSEEEVMQYALTGHAKHSQASPCLN